MGEEVRSGHKLTATDCGNHDYSSKDKAGLDLSLYFKPIKREIRHNWESSETDEEKGRAEMSSSILPLKPIPISKPTLCLNDLAFSPTTPIDGSLCSSRLSDGADTPTAFRGFSPSLEKTRTTSGRRQSSNRTESISSSRCSSPGSHLRRESEAELQKLQMRNKAPSIGGKVSPLRALIGIYPICSVSVYICCHGT